MRKRRKTAGALQWQASSDRTKYDPLEIGHALCENIDKELEILIKRSDPIMGEDEYFLCLFYADDPLIKGVIRHKYAAFLFMPSPRPQQVCFLYNKITQKYKRLWALPDAMVMAKLSCMSVVDKKWKQTKAWCDAFFEFRFWEHIRKEHNITHLSEYEFLDAHREEIVKPGTQDLNAIATEPFDFSKISINKIVDTNTALAD